MKVIVKGQIKPQELAEKLIEVAQSTAERMEKENEGVKITGFDIHEAEVTVKYHVQGMDDPQVLTVEHHKGHPELLTWIVDMDEDTTANNEDESAFDEWSVAKAQGKEHQFAEIVSVYKDEDLTEESAEHYEDMSKVVYSHKEGFKVAKIFQDGKLIQEIKLIPKEKEQV